MRNIFKSILFFSLILYLLPLRAQLLQVQDATLSGYKYPFAVKYFEVSMEGSPYKMAYMDVAASGKNANPETIVLLHGKNFSGAYWKQTISYLSEQGYRVIVPDQIGFGKSDKPEVYYTFHQLAHNTNALLLHLGIKKTTVVGHSMGGMLATRFALLYPEQTHKLILENPIGLEDYRTFVPYKTIEELYQEELKRTEASIRNYHKTYYTAWKPAYDEWVQLPASQIASKDYPVVAKAAALTYAMIFQQPVVYEFSQLKVPVMLVIGQTDRTIVGKGYIKDKQKVEQHGQYPLLGQQTAGAIPNAKLIELSQIGHIPHIEAPAQFHKALTDFLKQN
ncbi:alpha/beta fold hydrolase [Pontibacter arcticus]|uniref:Alpha/beta hydrolase n=1 Tax=Pontibacter arcticus TaxID=2080288 RepID=A0A364RC78_9BACT|nr:alpha/beta hydrolase [Pontibacter arcticus]RAU81766.1 alpha/beta hydrolase [Pontibacter arcticus]